LITYLIEIEPFDTRKQKAKTIQRISYFAMLLNLAEYGIWDEEQEYKLFSSRGYEPTERQKQMSPNLEKIRTRIFSYDHSELEVTSLEYSDNTIEILGGYRLKSETLSILPVEEFDREFEGKLSDFPEVRTYRFLLKGNREKIDLFLKEMNDLIIERKLIDPLPDYITKEKLEQEAEEVSKSDKKLIFHSARNVFFGILGILFFIVNYSLIFPLGQSGKGVVVGYSEYQEDPIGKAPIIKFKVKEREYTQTFPLYESKIKYSLNEELKLRIGTEQSEPVILQITPPRLYIFNIIAKIILLVLLILALVFWKEGSIIFTSANADVKEPTGKIIRKEKKIFNDRDSIYWSVFGAVFVGSLCLLFSVGFFYGFVLTPIEKYYKYNISKKVEGKIIGFVNKDITGILEKELKNTENKRLFYPIIEVKNQSVADFTFIEKSLVSADAFHYLEKVNVVYNESDPKESGTFHNSILSFGFPVGIFFAILPLLIAYSLFKERVSDKKYYTLLEEIHYRNLRSKKWYFRSRTTRSNNKFTYYVFELNCIYEEDNVEYHFWSSNYFQEDLTEYLKGIEFKIKVYPPDKSIYHLYALETILSELKKQGYSLKEHQHSRAYYLVKV
jgi:hypothetical protein